MFFECQKATYILVYRAINFSTGVNKIDIISELPVEMYVSRYLEVC